MAKRPTRKTEFQATDRHGSDLLWAEPAYLRQLWQGMGNTGEASR